MNCVRCDTIGLVLLAQTTSKAIKYAETYYEYKKKSTQETMKATLTFNLPDDQYSYDYTINAARYKDALQDIMNIMRNEVKYGNYDEGTCEVIDNLYMQFGEVVGDLLL
jgi:hypothetical protein